MSRKEKVEGKGKDLSLAHARLIFIFYYAGLNKCVGVLSDKLIEAVNANFLLAQRRKIFLAL